MGIKNKITEKVFFNVLRRKTLKRMETNQYQEIEKRYQKCIFWVFLSLLPTKKRENRYKALYIGKQRDIAKKMYNECFIVQKIHKAKNAKTRVNAETHE